MNTRVRFALLRSFVAVVIVFSFACGGDSPGSAIDAAVVDSSRVATDARVGDATTPGADVIGTDVARFDVPVIDVRASDVRATDAASTDVATADSASRDVADLPDTASSGCTPIGAVGDSTWTGRLVVEPGAELCAYAQREIAFNLPEDFETPVRDALRAAIANKGRAVISAGTYRIPTANAATGIGLPMCVRDSTGSSAAGASTSVAVQMIEGGFGGPDGYYVSATLPFEAGSLALEVTLPLEPPTLTFGTNPAPSHLPLRVLRGTEILYASCALEQNQCTSVNFGELGSVVVDEHTWRASPGLGFAQTVAVRGNLQGQIVVIDTYDDLTTVYGHHAFDRYTFARFPVPVGGACGVRIRVNVENEWSASLADCNGIPLGSSFAGTATSRSCFPD